MATHQEAHYKTMNNVGKAASRGVPIQYVRTFICVYNALLYIHCVCILGMHKHKKHLCQDHKINTKLL
jgi:hypothetical protein